METAIIIFIGLCLVGAGSIFIPEWSRTSARMRKPVKPLRVYVRDSQPQPMPIPTPDPYDEIIDVAPEDIKLISQTQRRIEYDK